MACAPAKGVAQEQTGVVQRSRWHICQSQGLAEQLDRRVELGYQERGVGLAVVHGAQLGERCGIVGSQADKAQAGGNRGVELAQFKSRAAEIEEGGEVPRRTCRRRLEGIGSRAHL